MSARADAVGAERALLSFIVVMWRHMTYLGLVGQGWGYQAEGRLPTFIGGCLAGAAFGDYGKRAL